MSSLKTKLESLLFVAGKPLTVAELSKHAKVDPKLIKETVDGLIHEYKDQQRGVAIMRQGSKVQMVTSPENAKVVDDFVKEDLHGSLSRAALETLAIITYRGPITKLQIDAIRGVNSAIMLRNLLIRGLIERKRWEKDRRQYIYNATMDLMRFLGIAKLSDLPHYQEYHQEESMAKIIEEVEKEMEQAMEQEKPEKKKNNKPEEDKKTNKK